MGQIDVNLLKNAVEWAFESNPVPPSFTMWEHIAYTNIAELFAFSLHELRQRTLRWKIVNVPMLGNLDLH